MMRKRWTAGETSSKRRGAAGMSVLALACIALPVTAGAAPYAYSLSGEQFIRMMSHPAQLSPVQYMDRERAYSYLDGAKDATAGIAWCPPRPRKTFELAYDAADYLKTLTPAALQGNAATLLLTYLRSQYPCKGGKP